MLERLIDFLNQDLEVSAEAISLAKRVTPLQPHTLPIILWQYGLINSQQLDYIYDWLEIA